MTTTQTDHGSALRTRLDTLALADPDYWSFRGSARRDHGHGLMQYPAMMVPQMVRALLDGICEIEPQITHVGDPFVGSGTVLTETTLRGLAFTGRDINPLALLLCRVKAGPIFPEAMRERADELIARIKADTRDGVIASFDGLDKWFLPTVQIHLSRIRRAIRKEEYTWARRFFWVVLAETVRWVSNSRTSTFKLHVRTMDDIEHRPLAAIETFERLLKRNLEKYASLGSALRDKGFLYRGRYSSDVNLVLGDSRVAMPGVNGTPVCDVVITSPPYGDNVTTVPYGQYSFLPLQWIDLNDIHPAAKEGYLQTTHEIDRRSLGGSRRIEAGVIGDLQGRSPTLKMTMDALTTQPRDRGQRVAAFVRDLDGCLSHVLGMLRSEGIMVWVLGNRRVGGRALPLDAILTELLTDRGSTLVTEVRRRIPSKRMAIRNNVAETMANETILVLRKGVS